MLNKPMSEFSMPSDHSHHLYKHAHPLIRKILELEISKRQFAKNYSDLFNDLIILREDFSTHLRLWLINQFSTPEIFSKINVNNSEELREHIEYVLTNIKLIDISIIYFQSNLLRISKLKLDTYDINKDLFKNFLESYSDRFRKIISIYATKYDISDSWDKYSFVDLLSQNCLLILLRDVIDISTTYTYLTDFNPDKRNEIFISYIKMHLLYKYHVPLGMNGLISNIEEMCYSKDDKKYTSVLNILINIEDEEINWSELLTQIMIKYLDQKITLEQLNTYEEKPSFFGGREHKEIINILDKLDSLNNAKAVSDRYDALLKNLICLIIYDLEMECPDKLNNRVMEKLMLLDDIYPNYSRFQFNQYLEDNSDGKSIPLEYQEWIQPLVLKKIPTTGNLLNKITLRQPYKVKEESEKFITYTINKNYIMEEYKKFKLKFFN